MPLLRRRRSWSDLPLRAKALAILLPPLLIVVVAALASVAVANQQTRHADTTRVVLDTSDDASQVFVSLLNAETAVRGYLATGDETFLQPWTWAVADLEGQLRDLIGAYGETAPAARGLAALARHEMTQLQVLIDDERAHMLPRADLRRLLRAGKATMDRARAGVASIQGRLQIDLQRSRARITDLRTAALVIAVAGLVVALLAVIGMYLFFRQVTHRIGAVRGDAHRLGLGESPRSAVGGGDEVGRLAAELRQASALLTTRSADLITAHQSALAAARDKSVFLSQLGHELRTPLTAIAGFGQLLESSPGLDPDDADSVTQIMHAAKHLMSLTDEVSDIGGRDEPLALSPDTTALAEVAREVCALMGPLAAERDVAIAVEVPAGARVRANRQRLSQVLINLVSNAIKYNHVGGHVRIGAQTMISGRLRLTVTDTGRGIPPELQPRVFAPFERLDAAADGIEGHGIGLALSRTYVEAMGGAIGVHSTPRQGATFWIELPATSGPVPSPVSRS